MVLVMINIVWIQFVFGRGGLGPRAAVIWAATTILCLIWGYFRLPEMRNRTPAEIDILFEQKVPARQWPGEKLE